jgi:Helix-turn-helix domain
VSNKALSWAFALRITGARKAVLVALADHAAEDGTSYPSLPRIALWAGTTARGARKAMRELEAAGLVTTEHATGQRSRYRLALGAETPEPGSSPSRTGPRNDVPPPPEPRSGDPGTTFPRPRNDVPPNPHRTPIEPPLNPQGTREAADGGLFHGNETQTTPKPKRPKRTAQQIDAAWQPDVAGVAFARELRIADVAAEVERFRDYWLGKGQPMADFGAAWRNWCRRAPAFAARSGASRTADGRRAALARSWLTEFGADAATAGGPIIEGALEE